jgi:hypothetical protein
MGALALRPADLREFGGQPRVQDLRLAEVLGFERPRDIRKLIQRHFSRLEAHGEICATVAQIKPDQANPRGAGRRATEYHLNERQAYRICMWSDAPNADAVQEQMVEVFFAWRHGKLAPIEVARDPLSDVVARLELLERAAALHPVRDDARFAMALAHMPVKKSHHYPAFWSDLPLREMAIRTHRQMTGKQAIALMQSELGRAPSKSSLARFWLWLDGQTGRAVGRKAVA